MRKSLVVSMMCVSLAGVAFTQSVIPVHAATKREPVTKAEPRSLQEYLATIDDLGKVRFYESDKLSPEILCSRKESGVIIIERLEGVCKDTKGSGRVINAYYEENNYICYSSVVDAETGERIRKGDHVDTYAVYDNTDSEDGIIYRFDYIVK